MPSAQGRGSARRGAWLAWLAAAVFTATLLWLLIPASPTSPDLRAALREQPPAGEDQPLVLRAGSPPPGKGERMGPPSSADEPAADMLQLAGVVVEAETGTPLADVLVYNAGNEAPEKIADGPHTRSDAEGRFELAVPVSMAPERLVARAEGHVPFAQDVPADDVGRRAMRIELARGASIHGVVTDPAGRPLPDVTVWALGAGAHGRSRFQDVFRAMRGPLPTAARSVTDEAGRFEVTGLGSEPCRLVATKPGWLMVPGEAPPPRSDPRQSLPLLSPRVRVVSPSASPVELRMEPVYALSYQACDAETGAPLETYRVVWRSDSSARWQPAGVDDSNWFSGAEADYRARRAYFLRRDANPAAPDGVTLRVEALGYERANVTAVPRSPDAPDFLAPQRVLLQRTAEPGRVRIRISIDGDILREPLLMRVASHAARSFMNVNLAAPDTDGAHTVTLPAGTYRCTVLGSLSLPTLDARSRDVVIEEGKTTEAEIELMAGAVELHVTGAGGEALDGAVLRITSNDEFARSWLVQKQDSRLLLSDTWASILDAAGPGVFRFYVVPGSYSVKVGCHGYQDHDYANVLVRFGRQTSLRCVLGED